ncbi:hypothetical protein M0802_002610 [Mischocyttarus mexicanus]|nr:hypothetical protein M0802_002610 [Mischocyttarus mexicanus]
MSTLMMPTTMTTMTNPGPIPAHSVPQKIEPPKLSAAATLAHTTTAANKSETSLCLVFENSPEAKLSKRSLKSLVGEQQHLTTLPS